MHFSCCWQSSALLKTTDYQTLTSSMWQIRKSSDGAQVLLRPPLSLQHLVTGGQTEGPGSWTAVQRPGSKKKECSLQTLLSYDYPIPEHHFNSRFSTLALLLLASITKPGILVLFLFKAYREKTPALPCTRKVQNMVGESPADVHPCITPKCENDVLDSVREIPDLPPGLSVWFQACQCLQKPEPSQMPH